jgi:hypothetical protein
MSFIGFGESAGGGFPFHLVHRVAINHPIRRIMGVLQKYGFTAPQFLLQQSEPGVHLSQGKAVVSRFGFSYTYLPDL